MDSYSLWLIFLLILLSCAGVSYITRHFMDISTLEAEIKKKFNEKRYADLVADLEKWKGGALSPAAAMAAARSYGELSRQDEALQQYKSVLKRLTPKDTLYFTALYESASLLFEKKQLAAAEPPLRDALSIQPKNAAASFLLAQVLYLTERGQEALAILEPLLTEISQEVQSIKNDIHGLIAEILAHMGFFDKALPHYERLDGAGKRTETYGYAKTMKECGRFEKSVAAYNPLIRGRRESSRQSLMILECAEAYYDGEIFKEGLLFCEEFIPSLPDRESALLRYRRALILEALGDDFIALQEFSELLGDLPDIPELAQAVERWGSVLEYPALKRYYTSDTGLFEKFIEKVIPAGAAITRRTREYYVCTHGSSAIVFYRRYFPVDERIMQNVDRSYSSSCFRAAFIEIFSFSGAEKNLNLFRNDYTAAIVSGDSFLRRLSAESVRISRRTV